MNSQKEEDSHASRHSYPSAIVLIFPIRQLSGTIIPKRLTQLGTIQIDFTDISALFIRFWQM
jgi:hypothetical protein